MFKLQRIELETAALCRFFSSIRLILFFLFYFIIPARANVMVRSCHYSFFFFRLHRSHEPPLFTFVANSSIYKYIFTQTHTRIPAYSFIHLKLSKNPWFDSFPNIFFSFYDSWIFATCCGNAAFFPQNETKNTFTVRDMPVYFVTSFVMLTQFDASLYSQFVFSVHLFKVCRFSCSYSLFRTFAEDIAFD